MTTQPNNNEDPKVVEEIDIEEFAKSNPGIGAPVAKSYRIRIDKTIKVVATATITGRQILALVDKTPEAYKLYEHSGGRQPIPVGPDEVVDLREPGVERFTTMAKDHTEGAR